MGKSSKRIATALKTDMRGQSSLLIRDKVLLVVGRILAAVTLRDTHSLRVCVPEILLSTREPLHPWGQEATLETPRPVLLLVLVGWHDAAARGNLDEPDRGVDEEVGADTGDQTIRNRVCKRHDGDGEESGDRIAEVSPVDVLGGCGHEGTDNDQRAASSPGRDRGEDGREEDGDEEAHAGEHGSKSSLASFGNTSTGFNVRRNRGAAHQRTDGDTKRVDRVCNGRVFKVLCTFINGATETGHGVEGTGS